MRLTWVEALHLIRAVVYMWVAATSFSVSQLYKDSLAVTKRESRLINALIQILFWLSFVFGFFSIAAVAQALDLEVHEILIGISPIFVIRLGFLINKFRVESITRRDEKK